MASDVEKKFDPGFEIDEASLPIPLKLVIRLHPRSRMLGTFLDSATLCHYNRQTEVSRRMSASDEGNTRGSSGICSKVVKLQASTTH